MALIPWRGKQREREPGRVETSPLAALRTEMDRLFDEFFREPLGAFEWPLSDRGWVPPVDVIESDEEVTVRAEIPGVDPQRLDLSMVGNQLVLAGEKKDDLDRSGRECHASEIRYGPFRRSIPLPANVDDQRVQADCTHGVLTIRLKKVQPTPAKRIEVKAR